MSCLVSCTCTWIFPVYLHNASCLTMYRLQKTQVDASKIAWITDCLTDRPQFVRLNGCVSERSAAPQSHLQSSFGAASTEPVQIHCNINCYRSSFLPTALTIYYDFWTRLNYGELLQYIICFLGLILNCNNIVIYNIILHSTAFYYTVLNCLE